MLGIIYMKKLTIIVLGITVSSAILGTASLLMPEIQHQAEVQEKASKAADAIDRVQQSMDKLCADYPGFCQETSPPADYCDKREEFCLP